MKKFLIEETYRFKGLHRATFEERMENMNRSLELVEKEYHEKHGDCGLSFENWLTGGVQGLRDNDYRRKYMEALILPIRCFERTFALNDAGEVVCMGIKRVIRRSFSISRATRKTDKSGMPREIIQGRDRVNTFASWFDGMSNSGTDSKGNRKAVTFNDAPDEQLLVKEEQEERSRAVTTWLLQNGIKPEEIGVAIEYLDRKDDGRGMQKELCQDMNITRGKLQYLIKRMDKIIDEIDHTVIGEIDFTTIDLIQALVIHVDQAS